MSEVDEMQSDIELKAYFIKELEDKIDLLERKLELAIVQRNKAAVYNYSEDERRRFLAYWNTELEELE